MKIKNEGPRNSVQETYEYQLTPLELAVIGRYNATIVEIENQRRGALNMILAANGLQGEWMLSGDKLLKRRPQ